MSPWIVTPEALAPFRIAQPPRPAGDPAPLPYLRDDDDQREGALDLFLEVTLLTPDLRDKGLPPHRLAVSNTRHLYWTVAQMVAHHASNGCNLQPGDLLGSGTISAPTADGYGSLLEITEGGKAPVRLPSGEHPTLPRGRRRGDLPRPRPRDGHATIGFGEVRGRILPAR